MPLNYAAVLTGPNSELFGSKLPADKLPKPEFPLGTGSHGFAGSTGRCFQVGWMEIRFNFNARPGGCGG